MRAALAPLQQLLTGTLGTWSEGDTEEREEVQTSCAMAVSSLLQGGQTDRIQLASPCLGRWLSIAGSHIRFECR